MIFRFINKRRETLLSLPKTFMPDRKVVCIQGLGFGGEIYGICLFSQFLPIFTIITIIANITSRSFLFFFH